MDFSIFFYGFLSVFTIITLIFLLLIVRNSYRFFSKKSNKKDPGGLVKNLLIVIVFLITLLGASTLFYTYFIFRTYKVLNREIDVGVLRCKKVDNKMKFTFIPKNPNKYYSYNNQIIDGNIWYFDAYIVKWEPFMDLLGFKTIYKLNAIYGRRKDFKNKEISMSKVYPVSKKSEKIWEFLLKYEKQLPFIESIYGSSVFQYPSNKNKFIIKISRTGVTLNKRRITNADN